MARFEWRTSLCAPDFPAAAYEALRLRVTDHTPFNSLGWLIAAEQTLDASEHLHILLGWEADKLRLCLPLVASRERFAGIPFGVVHHLGYPLADRLALLSVLEADSLRQALLLIRQRIPHALLQLNELSEPAGEESVLTEWMARSSTGERRLSCRVPVHLISDADLQEVSGDPRYKLRRARKRIAACGAVVRRIIPDAVTMGPLLQAISEVEAVSWKGDEGVGIFASERSRRCIESAFTALAAQGLVRVVTLELDGRCISYRLGLLEQGRLYDYNLAFLPQYADLGSGRVLLEEWIRWGLDDHWRWIDASRVSLENSSHQLHERMTGQLEHWRWSFYSWRPSGLLLGLGLRVWQRLKPKLQQWRARRQTAIAQPVGKPAAITTEGEHASPSHSQR
ncbi:cellulose biosynthesis protein [Pseudomonas sp. FW215-R2]|uniref:GNAT family N-acetyltransferase n=1 Tax=unclassified Pseudomonas TaxID=196821 RepID=UPI000C87F5FE|nr:MULTISPECIES: GNAT family N-acetyltransferase [unclassified Pseudomonas]PMW95663.1 cellulose biosynthesis protein [Pseudomonas sp. FW215-R2]PMX05936.1 cellulose biosynthesis protein [Pseudomonas sp. FW215-L1]PMX18973.1 cellulose biosynthesis protein [Pseudomonas sp. FW215-E1]PNA21846.1 cellulose biosynthesis protein [Pseudomonas sp. FW215-R4]